MRRLLAAALCLIPLAAVACGGSSSGAKSPLDDALGYLPKTAPLTVAIDTDVKGDQWKSLEANLEKLPLAGVVESSLKQSLRQSGFDYDKDIKPLLGNEFVVGAPSARSIQGNSNDFVGALQAKDKGKLASVLSRSPDLTKDGSSHGATLYRSREGNEAAQTGNVLVVARTKPELIAALEQRKRADRLTEADFDKGLTGLSGDAIIRLSADLRSLLNSDPTTTQARKIKWVSALRTFGLTLSSQSDGLALDFDLKIDPSGLTDADLPLASGTASPPVAAAPGEIGLGIRGLDKTIGFGESAAQAVSPASYGDFERAKAQLGKSIGVDVDRDIVGQLSGNATVSFDTNGHYSIRAEPKDPNRFKATLAKFARVAPSFARGAGLPGAKLTRVRGLYKLAGSNGRATYYGMVGQVFVASNDLGRLGQMAARTPQPVSGARGAFATSTDVGRLLAKVIGQASGGGLGGSFGGSLVSGPIGKLTGWTSSSTSGLSGHLKLEIR